MSGRMILVCALLLAITMSAQTQENPLSLYSTQQQFLSTLGTRQEQNRRSIGQNDYEILNLENRLAQEQADQTRQQSELFRLNATPAGSITDEMQRSEAQRQVQIQLDQSRARQDRLGAELQRRQLERGRLGSDQQVLQRLQSEYDADPTRASELTRRLNSR